MVTEGRVFLREVHEQYKTDKLKPIIILKNVYLFNVSVSLRAISNSLAGRIWPAGRHLKTPVLDNPISKNTVQECKELLQPVINHL